MFGKIISSTFLMQKQYLKLFQLTRLSIFFWVQNIKQYVKLHIPVYINQYLKLKRSTKENNMSRSFSSNRCFSRRTIRCYYDGSWRCQLFNYAPQEAEKDNFNLFFQIQLIMEHRLWQTGLQSLVMDGENCFFNMHT